MRTPGIGDRVHFVYGEKDLPAIITEVAVHTPDPVGGVDMVWEALTVFPVGEPPFTALAAFDPAFTPATWHWPEAAAPTVSRVGDQVLYVLDSGPYAGEARPATVVKVWDAMAGYVNLVVLLDGGNDDPTASYPAPLLRWVTSVRFDPDKVNRTWHWGE